MSKIIYAGSFDVKGPILLNLSDLISLDEILEQKWNQISEDINKKISKHLEEQKRKYPTKSESELRKDILNYGDYKSDKKLIIKFKTNNTLQANTFTEAAKNPSIQNELPVSFSYIMEAGKFSVEIDIKKYSIDELSIKVAPEDHVYTNDMIYELKKWSNSIRPILPLRIWKTIHGFHWIVCGFILLFMSWVIIPISNKYDRELTRQGNILLENGIDKTNVDKAIEILLSKELNFVPKNQIQSNASVNYVLLLIIGITLLICVLISFIPKTNIGIGIGEKKIIQWKRWITFLFFTIPSSVIIPWILGKVFSLL